MSFGDSTNCNVQCISEEIPPPLYKSQERPITGQQLVQCVYTAY
ncbi:hypothetical protein T4B_10849 [Trichinella pseudospiralis]|uniref:Uncharacterized protein n=1 Tax=Trichinella pseudospiralis TaxID=6337 RepID=A0A0V1GNI1_TRIPS|nr:hypothetical protein T4B_10180 [Trichinella pseudospiralis]KRY99781.1 hypothetical protein T4B_10849 [Trichinella pseudospiralis]KRZ20334.1 hypothetical protein T4C_8157 [Trichinella pseudospiralis]